MPVTKIKTADLLKELKIELTPEQKKGLTEEFDFNTPDVTWEEVQTQFKPQLNAMKEATIKKRFKSHNKPPAENQNEKESNKEVPPSSTPPKPQIDIAAIKQEITDQVNRQVRTDVFINNFQQQDRDDALAIFNAKLDKGVAMEEAMKSTAERFTQPQINMVDFGERSQQQSPPGESDELLAALEKEANK